jgi:hypothetical protein
MATLADLWEGEQDVAPKKSSMSTYKANTQIGPSSSTLADLWDAPETVSASKAPAPAPAPKKVNPIDALREKHLADIQGVGELGRNLVSGLFAAPASAVAGVIGTLTSGKYGTPEGIQEGQKVAQNVQERMTYQPPSQRGQELLAQLQSKFEASKVPPLGVPELMGMQSAQRPSPVAVPKVRIEKVAGAVEPQATAGSVGSAKVNTNPLIGQISGEEAVRGTFPQYKISKIGEDVPATEQATRASVINRIYQDVGKENNQIRQGVLTGNEDTLRTEHTKANMANPTPEAELLKRQIADEQNTLSQFAAKRVQNTGADQNLLYPSERGERVNDFFAGSVSRGEEPTSLPSLFKQEKQKLYQEANDKVGNNPIQTNNVDQLLNNKQFAAGLKLTNNEGVASGAKELIELAKTVGFEDQSGVFHPPNTIGAWDAVRKSLNQNWTKDNAKVIRKINQAIDNDIASAGGGDLLKKADDLHKMEKELFSSKGIKDIFGEIDSNGVETGKVSFDKLLERLNGMPANQWKHIYDVADRMATGKITSKSLDKNGNPLWSFDVPPEVQQSAQLAKNEMLGSLAREVYNAGAGKSDVWLHDSANKVLNARAEKIAYAFPLEEQQAFRDLNASGYLMPGRHSYEGGGQQIRRVNIIEGNLGKFGTTAGAGLGTAIAGPGVGTAVGGYIGNKLGVAGQEALAKSALNKEALKTQEQMKKNAQMGSNKLKDIKK